MAIIEPDIVWRIFGLAHSPFVKVPLCDFIKPIVNKYVSKDKREPIITEICGWFVEDKTLVDEMKKPVAVILSGAGNVFGPGLVDKESEIATWAVGSVDADRAACLIRSRWSADQIDSFADAALNELKKVVDRDEVFDPNRSAQYAGFDNARIAVVDIGDELKTFQHLNGSGLRLVYCVRDEVTNLVKLVLEMRPGLFHSMIERVDHPVLQACAANHMIDIAREKPPDWIRKDVCSALIALDILHTLERVNRLDEEIHGSTNASPPKKEDLEPAVRSLFVGLVERLGALDPADSVRWIGELLTTSYVLRQHVGSDASPRIVQLEKVCNDYLVRLVQAFWSEEMFGALCAGLRRNQRSTWTRHLADIAWEIRDTDSARSCEIARTVLLENDRSVTDHISSNNPLLWNWDRWEDREWLNGLGVALALSHREIDLPEWVMLKCVALPLRVWDAEEEPNSFYNANVVAQQRFLIAFLAIPTLKKLDRMVHPSEVLKLADYLWAHNKFITEHNSRFLNDMVVEQFAARCAVEFGSPSDSWLLDCVRYRGVGPSALWALMDQRLRENRRVRATDDKYHTIITTEIRTIASERYDDEGPFSLEDLKFWGQLWLVLEAADEAEQTAVEMMALLQATDDRKGKIMVMKLLALVVSKRPDKARGIEQSMGSLYRDLWPGSYTSDEEHQDRKQIDEKLGKEML